jgi:hypothetical protein
LRVTYQKWSDDRDQLEIGLWDVNYPVSGDPTAAQKLVFKGLKSRTGQVDVTYSNYLDEQQGDDSVTVYPLSEVEIVPYMGRIAHRMIEAWSEWLHANGPVWDPGRAKPRR